MGIDNSFYVLMDTIDVERISHNLIQNKDILRVVPRQSDGEKTLLSVLILGRYVNPDTINEYTNLGYLTIDQQGIFTDTTPKDSELNSYTSYWRTVKTLENISAIMQSGKLNPTQIYIVDDYIDSNYEYEFTDLNDALTALEKEGYRSNELIVFCNPPK